jgi:hypothetical protein
MAVDVPLKCSCGSVQGVAKNISPETGNHIVCYCEDCQAFAKYLKRDADILDEYGGTDIFQVTPSQVEITAGSDQLRCIRLTEKGLFRWHTECCKTPVGNMISSGMPFIGVVHNFMDDEGVRDKNLGPVTFYSFGKSATSTPPDDKNDKGFPIFKMLAWIINLLINKIKGLQNPNAFFDDTGKPISEPVILEAVNK